ncbi:MAG: hypothetical protein NTV08_09190 [Verrucomicrobia bacterium]|nr:hypothetical protein [Verrucomicrobiota bacterium]
MLWFCSGHFAATWLVCLTLIFRFHAAADKPLTFVIFALILWPVVLELLPLRGYFALKRVTLDRLKSRVNCGELKKAIVFAFGFCTSIFAAIGIGAAAWGFGLLDGWLGKMSDGVSVMSTLAWLPVTFVLWIVPPVIAVALLAGRAEKALADKPGFKHETANV